VRVLVQRQRETVMDMKIELILVPVTDVDRARDFWAGIGWHVDYDSTVSEEIRFVQITPPGSACSIAFGKGISPMAPGSLDAVQLVIPDADEALAMLNAASRPTAWPTSAGGASWTSGTPTATTSPCSSYRRARSRARLPPADDDARGTS
jgi:hypothetical protein